MTRPKIPNAVLAALLLSATSTYGARQGSASVVSRPGVVIEGLGSGSALANAGLRVGDRLLAWETSDDDGQIDHFFDWAWIVDELAPRGSVRLRGERRGEPLVVDAPPGLWDATVRPDMPPAMAEEYVRGKEYVASDTLRDAVVIWSDLAADAERQGESALACWLWMRLGEKWVDAGNDIEASVAQSSALAMAGEAVVRATVWRTFATAFHRRADLPRAMQANLAELETRLSMGGESLALAKNKSELGDLLARHSQLNLAQRYADEALQIQLRLAPMSLELADTWNHLGIIADFRGTPARAEELYRRALEIRERLAPDSLLVASSLQNLGAAAELRGDLDAARAHLMRAVSLKTALAPSSLTLAGAVNNLGILERSLGDLETAELRLLEALTILESLAPQSERLASVLNNLGVLALDRGDIDLSATYQERAKSIRELVGPRSLQLAQSLYNLGELAWKRGETAAAREHLERGLFLYQELAPGSLRLAETLDLLGRIFASRDEWESAEEAFQRALELRRSLAPRGMQAADSLLNLGKLYLGTGHMEAAAESLLEALDIQQSFAPDSSATAETLHVLARLYGSRGDLPAAIDHAERAVDTLERQVGTLGGSHDTRAGFRAGRAQYYRQLIDLLIESGRTEEAFHTFERSRARGLLDMLAERDVVFGADIPTELDALRRRLLKQYDRSQSQLWELEVDDVAQKRDAITRELGELRGELDRVAAAIRRASPRLAALQYPEPLDASASRRVLDEGTVLLAYSVGEERTHVFVLGEDSKLQVTTLPIRQDELERDIETFRDLILKTRSSSVRLDALIERGRQLYRRLVGPIEPWTRGSAHILIVPDGPLHILPFGALVRDLPIEDADTRSWQYLIEWKPVHFVLSTTLYGELRRSRRPAVNLETNPRVIVAFGDPYRPQNGDPDAPAANQPQPDADAERFGSRQLAPLLGSREEVQRIAALYGDAAEVYLGRRATEARAKSVGREPRYLHFATHAILNERFPLSSALVLAAPESREPGSDNGLLQAWEIFESMRIDADLVVLSSCESGLGRELHGEGLFGLTRAFLYAGAHSVVASQWIVSDQATGVLMTRFYQHLKSGQPKDEALRSAQLDLIRAPLPSKDGAAPGGEGAGEGERQILDASTPYYWAAFQLTGDRH